jgi:tRNA threonylcarbamoyl adenosine modification protein YeaZ
LALDGALGTFSCCFADGGERFSAASAGNDALEAGLTLVARVLREAGTDLAHVDRLAVGTGPGSFTGLRIAVSYAKGLALARHLPLVGISSYDALEPPDVELPVLTVVEGRAGIVCARLRTAAGTVVRCGRTAEVVDELARSMDGQALALAGAAEGVFAALGERGLSVRHVQNRAKIAAEAVADLALRAEPRSPHALRPDYGELPAAKVPRLS